MQYDHINTTGIMGLPLHVPGAAKQFRGGVLLAVKAVVVTGTAENRNACKMFVVSTLQLGAGDCPADKKREGGVITRELVAEVDPPVQGSLPPNVAVNVKL